MGQGVSLASLTFPGLPRFFCSSVFIDGCGRAALFRIHVLLSMQTEEQKERGRPENEARVSPKG